MAMAAREAILALGMAFLLAASASAHDFVNFGYSGATGPDKWGSLSPEYKLCSNGKQQSPINIVKEAALLNRKLDRLDRDYVDTSATLVDYGFNIVVKYSDDAGHVTVEGKNYSLIQMHWHSPSEHTINGERFAVELHLVHKSDDGSIAVVAILYQLGRPDPFLVQLKDKFDEMAKETCGADQEARVPIGEMELRAVKRHTRKYYRYVGSLTSPPCTENVIWNILGKVRQMSREQLVGMRAPLDEAYRNNSRPIQPLNGRTVQLYDENK
ncbi:hypothetical protein Cni_G12777 [Canna indica]|uniref:Carbonic anhydrase n=1 Tax=Canna indica TaxID=4628 RepID=A0AAQ3Q9B4_9LILI|nr:hypothetical protein Cni_G12777 [Canna indica]